MGSTLPSTGILLLVMIFDNRPNATLKSFDSFQQSKDGLTVGFPDDRPECAVGGKVST